MGKRERVNAAASTELSDDLDLANDGFVERPNIFSRNPVFPMLFAAGLLHLIAIQKCLGDEETCDVSLAAGGHVPVTRNLQA